MKNTNAPDREKKRKDKKARNNPRETVYPEQSGQSGAGDAYNGDDKHGPMDEETVEKERD